MVGRLDSCNHNLVWGQTPSTDGGLVDLSAFQSLFLENHEYLGLSPGRGIVIGTSLTNSAVPSGKRYQMSSVPRRYQAFPLFFEHLDVVVGPTWRSWFA